MFDVSIMGFSGMPDIVVLSENILDIALWVENPRWPPFAQGLTINWYIFRQNRSRVTILVSTIWFSGMPDLVVGLEITLDIALLVKSKMADICPRSNNIFVSYWYHFGHHQRRFMIFLSHIGFARRPIFCNYRTVSKILDSRQNMS